MRPAPVTVEFTSVSERNTTSPFLRGKTLLLDGGLGTALAAAGVALSGPLWTARAVLEAPAAVRAAHRSFFEAGADVATAASYQATDPALIRAAVGLAREAAGSQRLVAGSVGPYGAVLADRSEYTGAYAEPAGGWVRFHAPRIAALAAAGADFLLCETLPRFDEIRALADCLRATRLPALISVTLRDPAHLPDGTPLAAVAAFLDAHPAVAGYGVNCCPGARAAAAVAMLGRRPAAAKPLVLYPNGPLDSGLLAAAGAAVLGGCCGTLPGDIAALRRLLDAAARDSAPA